MTFLCTLVLKDLYYYKLKLTHVKNERVQKEKSVKCESNGSSAS